MRYVIAFFFLVGLASAQCSNGATCCTGLTACTTTDACQTNVMAALNSINLDNTVVNIPANTCSWSAATVFPPAASVNNYIQTNSFTINCAGAQHATGTAGNDTLIGSDQTVIEDNVSHSPTDNPLLRVTTIPGKAFTLQNCAIIPDPANATQSGSGIMRILGNAAPGSTQVRITANHIKCGNGSLCMDITDQFGVMDHNFIETAINAIGVFNSNWQSPACPPATCSLGHGSWNDYPYWGSSQAFFLEDNIGSATRTNQPVYINDCANGGRIVIRYNVFQNQLAIQQHNGSGGLEGCRTQEIYNNSAIYSGTTAFTFIYGRAGSALVHHNTMQNYINAMSAYDDRSTDGQTDHKAPVPTSWGMSGGLLPGATASTTGTVTTFASNTTITFATGSLICANIPLNTVITLQDGAAFSYYPITTCNTGGGSVVVTPAASCAAGSCTWFVGSPCDGNADFYGYPTFNQMGRGRGSDLITGSSCQNNRTGTPFWPNEEPEPNYLFANNLTGENHYLGFSNSSGNTNQVVVENRDYFLEQPNVDEAGGVNCAGQAACTVGVGQGTLAQRPASCTVGVGYWETDHNQLDQCSGATVGVVGGAWSTTDCATGMDGNGFCHAEPYTYPHPLDVSAGTSFGSGIGIGKQISWR